MDVLGATPGSLLLDQAATGAEDARLRRLAGRTGSREDLANLRETAQEFEAVFLNQLMKVMRETVPENDLFNSGGATKFYRQMHDAEIARAMATGRSGLGVADLIVQQFAASVGEGRDQAAGDLSPGAASAAPPTPAAASERLPEPLIGPPAPVPSGPVLGPPAPGEPPGREAARGPTAALERYRSLAPVGRAVAAQARLRGLAEAQGAAVADTLARFSPEIERAAADSGLEPSLILAVVMEESGGDPAARSAKGALGLMQLMPDTATEVGVADRSSPAQNLSGGADYLARMLRRYEGRLDLALAAYNAGPGNVDRAGRAVPGFPETERYVARVLERFRGLGGQVDTGTEIAMDGR